MTLRSCILGAICLLLVMAPTATAADRGQTAPVVRIILFWSEGCGHCHEVLEDVLPSLQQQYGSELEVRLVEVVSMEDISAFFDVAEAYGFARGRAAVPFLLIGERALMGVDQIRAELPGLVRQTLAAGGADWPALTVVANGATPVPADDACGFDTPCAEDGAALTPGLLAAALGLTAAAGIGLAGFRRWRARGRPAG